MIGKIIKNMRLKENLSQKKLGEYLAFADNTISSYERENSRPDFDTILKIANRCGYDFVIVDKDNNLISLEEMSKKKISKILLGAFNLH